MSEAAWYERDDGVFVLTLNKPAIRKAISPAIVEALVEYTGRNNAAFSVGSVIVTSEGKGFSSGYNVRHMRKCDGVFDGSPAEVRRGYLQGIQRIPLAVYCLEAPSIAAVNGTAVRAGSDLATMYDIRTAGRSAKFSESFPRVGLVAGDGGAWFLPCTMDLLKDYEITFTSDFVETEEATRLGLPSNVIDNNKLTDEAMGIACRTAAPPMQLSGLPKHLIRDLQEVSQPMRSK